jgi:hypothetical protein
LNIGGWITGAAGAITVPGSLTTAGFTSTGIDDNATSTAITIDASDNVGIGVTPETWHVDRTAIDIGFGSAFYAHNNSSRTYVSANEYQGAGGSSYYKNTAVASQYEQFSDGTHKFRVAPSGTADSAISWTTAMTIENGGSVLMGTSTLPGMQTGNIDDATVLYQGQIAATNSDGNYSAYFNKRTNTGGGFVRFNYNGSTKGSITTNGTSTAYNTSSDYRLKELDVPMEGSIDRLKLLRPINFAWKVDGTRTDGFLAHEAGEVVPECATGTKDAMMDEEYEVTPVVMDGETVVTEAVMGTRSVPDYQGIDQAKLVPLLVSALQEAIARIEVLENA